MDPDAAKRAILDAVVVSRSDVISAKQFVIEQRLSKPQTTRIIAARWLEACGFPKPGALDLDSQALEMRTGAAARYLSLSLAFCQAVQELMGASLVTPIGPTDVDKVLLGWSKRGTSSSFRLDEVPLARPEKLMRLFGTESQGRFTDGDLYLESIGVELPPSIRWALIEATRCLRADLFSACVVMLGAGAEALWSDLGTCIAASFPDDTKAQKVLKAVDSYSAGLGRVVQEVVSFLRDRARSDPLFTASGLNRGDIDFVEQWTEAVRDGRNVLHWGNSPQVENDYDKVSILMLGAVRSVRVLRKLANAATGLQGAGAE